MYWNGLLQFMNDGFIVFAVTSSINTFYLTGLESEFSHYGQGLSLILAMFFWVICLIFPFLMLIVLCKNFKKIKTRDKDTDKYNVLFKSLFIPRAGSYQEKYGSGKLSILFNFLSVSRILILAISLVSLLNNSTFCIFVINFGTLFMMISSELFKGLNSA